jgi:hypothetical protein
VSCHIWLYDNDDIKVNADIFGASAKLLDLVNLLPEPIEDDEISLASMNQNE